MAASLFLRFQCDAFLERRGLHPCHIALPGWLSFSTRGKTVRLLMNCDSVPLTTLNQLMGQASEFFGTYHHSAVSCEWWMLNIVTLREATTPSGNCSSAAAEKIPSHRPVVLDLRVSEEESRSHVNAALSHLAPVWGWAVVGKI